MPEELIILTDEEFEPDAGTRGGWSEPIKRAIGKLQEVKLDPAQVEARMSALLSGCADGWQCLDRS